MRYDVNIYKFKLLCWLIVQKWWIVVILRKCRLICMTTFEGNDCELLCACLQNIIKSSAQCAPLINCFIGFNMRSKINSQQYWKISAFKNINQLWNCKQKRILRVLVLFIKRAVLALILYGNYWLMRRWPNIPYMCDHVFILIVR